MTNNVSNEDLLDMFMAMFPSRIGKVGGADTREFYLRVAEMRQRILERMKNSDNSNNV